MVIPNNQVLRSSRARFARLLSVLCMVSAAGLCWTPSGRLGAQETPAVPATSTQDAPASDKPQSSAAEDEAARDLRQLENLLTRPVEVSAFRQEVTTVSAQKSTVGRSPAAVFVVTQEMIRRSGATCVPETLRMVPGLQVARANANQWSITSRGMNYRVGSGINTSNKLLVLIDGRTVYSPFSGTVYWDAQDVLLDDVDRIEVIRGPGATIYGANAVNGVINVITKPAAETQGGLVKAGGGSFEKGFASARIGGRAGDDVHYRLYGKWFERDSTFNAVPGRQADDTRQGRGGFRMDWKPSDEDTFTLQGDAYEGSSGFFNPSFVMAPSTSGDEQLRGGNVLTRWTHQFEDNSDITVQLYYDRADRLNYIGYLDQQFDTYDADFRHHLHLGEGHNVVWGLGYRSVLDKLTPSAGSPRLPATPTTPIYSFTPPTRTYNTASVFGQDEITLLDEELFLTLGSKLQHNDFTGVEIQPSARLLWSPEQTWATWASVSRAVRTPSRSDHDLLLISPPITVDFSRAFRSEELIAYEVGYRQQPAEWFSWDAALFFNQYENLASFRPFATGPIPFSNNHTNRGEGYGIELSATADITSDWRLSGWYSFLQLQIHPLAVAETPTSRRGPEIEGASPHNQLFLMSSHDLTDEVQFDLMGRYVDNLPFQGIPSYLSLDARLAWRPNPGWEYALVGQNLLDSYHPEFDPSRSAAFPTANAGTPGFTPFEIPRGVFAMVTRTW